MMTTMTMMTTKTMMTIMTIQVPDNLGKPSLLCKQHTGIRAPDDNGRGENNCDDDDTDAVGEDGDDNGVNGRGK